MRDAINVHVAFDEEAAVWYVTHSDVHGLRVEAPKIDQMIERVEAALQDLLDEGDGEGGCEVPVDIVAHHVARVRCEAA